jgi:pyridoxal phosphate-dependent aminotransferase EpsN
MDYVRDAIESNWIAPAGPHLRQFEEEICACAGMSSACALSSGTAGVHLALKALGVGRGDLVFCSDLTFAGSVNPVFYEGAQAVLIDSAPYSCNLDPSALALALEDAASRRKLPKALIAVDLYGHPADWNTILPLCQSYNVPVIEDAAEALGAFAGGKACGSFGAIGVFSFNGNKIITSSGGGMVVSNDAALIKKINFWANQSKENAPYYLHNEIGYNYRMSNICAAIGRAQLASLDTRIARRKQIFEAYKAAFADLPVRMLEPVAHTAPNHWLSVMLLESDAPRTAAQVVQSLEADNIEARRAWNPMHCQPVFAHCGYICAQERSMSEDFFAHGICLPSGSGMTDGEQNEVISRVRALCATK